MLSFARVVLAGPLFVLTLSLALTFCSPAHAAKRLALLIGNQSYAKGVGEPLANPHNDIKLVGDQLKNLKFEVTLLTDQNRTQMLKAVSKYVDDMAKAGSGAVGFFYYSGHGLAIDGKNYLLPVDLADVTDELQSRSVLLQEVIEKLRSTADRATHFVLFDACRNEFRIPGKSVLKGFEPVPEAGGMFIGFATSPNTSALDDGVGGGPYARALAQLLPEKGLNHVTLFDNLKQHVLKATKRRQVPSSVDGLVEHVYLAGEPDNLTSACARRWASGLQISFSLPELKKFEDLCRGTEFEEKAKVRQASLAPLRGKHETTDAKAEPEPQPGQAPKPEAGWFGRVLESITGAQRQQSVVRPAQPQPQLPEVSEPEQAAWNVALRVDTVSAYQEFSEKWPESRYVSEASATLRERQSKELSWQEAEAAFRRANTFVSRSPIDFRKVAIDGCSDKASVGALRGMGQAMALYRLMQKAFSANGLNTAVPDENFTEGGRLPVDLLSGVLEEGVGPLLQRLRIDVAPVIMRSKDLRAFAALLLEYKERFERRITDNKIEQIALKGELLQLLGDPKSERPCLNERIFFYIGVDEPPKEAADGDASAQQDTQSSADGQTASRAKHIQYTDIPHELLYGFWYRRHIEGNAWLAATALRRLILAN